MIFLGRKKEEHKFARVSKRGRVAYLILCFEQCLLFYGENISDWKWILEELWEITSTGDIDRWVSRVCDLSPETVLLYDSYEDLTAKIKEVEKTRGVTFWYEFNEEKFVFLQNLYRKKRAGFQVLSDMLDKICDVIADDWGETEEPFTPSCLHNIDEAEAILKNNGIPVPSNQAALDFIMRHKDKHYGKAFDGIPFSVLSAQKG